MLATQLHKETKLATKLCRIAVKDAKSAYETQNAQKIADLTGKYSKSMWQGIELAKQGNLSHHNSKKDMSFKLSNGKITKTDKEHMSVMEPHCIKIFNNHKEVSPQVLDYINQRQTSDELDNPITWKEQLME